MGIKRSLVLFYVTMPTFSPPTLSIPIDRDHPLWKFYDQTGSYSVLITGGTATTFPGKQGVTQDEIDAADSGSGFGGKAAFIGGREYTITAGEKTILDAAGYTTGA